MSSFTRSILTANTRRTAIKAPLNTTFKRNFHPSIANMVVHNVQDASKWDDAKKSGIVVVDCFATWCGPCKIIAPKLVEFSDLPEFKDVTFLKIDVDELPAIAQANSVSAMPTFLFFKDGQPITQADSASAKDGRVVGADPRKLKAVLDDLVNGSEKA